MELQKNYLMIGQDGVNIQLTYSIRTDYKKYNDVNNRQDAKTFSFINLFNSALHVLGNKFAHPQEHFLTVYTAFGTMQRRCC